MMNPKQKRIGILTFHHAINYGAYLQACALCNRLNQEDWCSCEIIDFRMRKELALYNYKKNRNIIKKILRPQKTTFLSKNLEAFENALHDPIMPLSAESMISDSQDEFIEFVQGKYDVIIVGSDEVWKIDNIRGFPNPYWLKGNLGALKVSYAASSLKQLPDMTSEQIEYCRDAWNDFQIISVRDHHTKVMVDTVLGNDQSFIACDPTFIYDFHVPEKEISEILNGKAHLNTKKRNMLIMVNNEELCYKLLQAFHQDYNLISVFDYHPGLINVGYLTPLDWLQLIKNCDCMMTTYFHGTCFSLINNTPFVSFGSERRRGKIEGLFNDAPEEIQRHYFPSTEELIKSDNFKEKLICKLMNINNTDHENYLCRQRNTFSQFLNKLNSLLME